MDSKKPKTMNLQNSIGLISDDKKKALIANNENIKQNLMEVQQILKENNEKEYIDPNTGDKIVNATQDRIWVAQNVAFIFSTGAVFDKNDKSFLDSVIDFFNNKNDSYLPCSFKTYPYSSDIVKKFESLEAIGNGNYHMCCFVICYADNEALEYFPEPMFSHRGICEHMVDDIEIRDEISRMMGLYGFTKEVFIQPSSVSKIGKRDNKTLPDIKLQYNTEIDYGSATNRELMSNIKTKENTIGTRTRICGNVNGKRSYPKIKNARNNIGNDVINRINADKYVSYTMPTEKLGINVKINDTYETRINSENNGPQKYELFDTNNNTDEKTTKYNGLSTANFIDTSSDIQAPSDYARNNKMKQLHKNNGDFRYINYGRR